MTNTRHARLAREKRLKFKARLRREYKKLIDSGMDPFVAKKHLLKRRLKLASILTMDQLRTILYRQDTPL